MIIAFIVVFAIGLFIGFGFGVGAVTATSRTWNEAEDDSIFR